MFAELRISSEEEGKPIVGRAQSISLGRSSATVSTTGHGLPCHREADLDGDEAGCPHRTTSLSVCLSVVFTDLTADLSFRTLQIIDWPNSGDVREGTSSESVPLLSGATR